MPFDKPTATEKRQLQAAQQAESQRQQAQAENFHRLVLRRNTYAYTEAKRKAFEPAIKPAQLDLSQVENLVATIVNDDISSAKLGKLKIDAGPGLYKLEQRYNEKRNERQKKWTPSDIKVSFYKHAFEIVEWDALKRIHEQVWNFYQKTRSQEPGFAANQTLFQALMSAYSSAPDHYQGLIAYKALLHSSSHAAFASFLNSEYRRFIQESNLPDIKALNNLPSDSNTLAKILQGAFAAASSPQSISTSTYQAPFLLSAASDDKDDTDDEKLPAASSSSFVRIDVIDDKPSDTQTTLYHDELEHLIAALNHCGTMREVVDLVAEQLRIHIEACNQLAEEQTAALAALNIQKHNAMNAYNALPSDEAVKRAVIESKIGGCDLNELMHENVPILHHAMKQYKTSKTETSSAIVCFLLERGCSPAVLTKTQKKQNAVEYAELTAQDIPLSWLPYLLKNIIPTTTEAQQVLTRLDSKTYYLTHWFFGLFYTTHARIETVANVTTGLLAVDIVGRNIQNHPQFAQAQAAIGALLHNRTPNFLLLSSNQKRGDVELEALPDAASLLNAAPFVSYGSSGSD